MGTQGTDALNKSLKATFLGCSSDTIFYKSLLPEVVFADLLLKMVNPRTQHRDPTLARKLNSRKWTLAGVGSRWDQESPFIAPGMEPKQQFLSKWFCTLRVV